MSSLILIQRQFVYRRAGFVGRIFYSPARRTFVVASKFRSGLVNENEREKERKDVRADVVDDGSLINF